MKIKKILTLLLTVIMVITMATACSSKDEPAETTTDSSLDYIKENGKLILGLDDSFPPMGFNDNGEIKGFDVDLAREVCKILDVELVLQPIDWDSKEQELNSKNIDCIWNGMSVTQERQESMSLSIPYMGNHMALVVKPDSGIKTISDMKGKSIALQTGSSANDAFNDSAELKEAVGDKLNGFSDNLSALMDLETGNSDAVLMDDVVANYVITEGNKDLIVLNDFLFGEEYAVGFRKEDVALTNAVNDALKELKSNGKLAEISTNWFGSDTTIIK